MKEEVVYTPVKDSDLITGKDRSLKALDTSPIWGQCYHEDEERPLTNDMWRYDMKFEGLKPIQITNVVHLKLVSDD